MNKLFIIIFILIGVVLPVVLYLNIPPNEDESYYILVSGDYARGIGIPYEDYASDPKPPGIYYLLTPIFYIFGPSVVAARLTLFFVSALAAIAIFMVAEKYKTGSGKIASLLYLTGMLLSAYEGFSVLTESFMVLFLALAVYFTFESKTSLGLLAAGALGGISFLFKQPGGFFLVFLIAYVLLEHRNKNFGLITSTKRIIAGIIGFIIPIALSLLHFYSLGALDEMLYWVFVVPSMLNPVFGIISVAGLYHAASFGIIWILALAYMTKLRLLDSRGISLLVVGLLSLIPWISIQFGHYLIPVMFVASIFASAFIVSNKHFLRKAAPLFIIILLLVGTVSVDLYSGYTRQVNSHQRAENLDKIVSYIKSNASPQENIFVFGYDPSIYMLSERRPPFRSYHILGHLLGNDEEFIKQQLDENVNMIVKITDCSLNVNICDFMMDRYMKVADVGNYEVFMKKAV